MTWYQWWWLGWFTVSFSAFSAVELWSVFTGHPERKLSQSCWLLQDSLPHPTVWRAIIFVFLCYIAFHLTFGPRH